LLLDPIIEKLEHTTRGFFLMGYNENQYLLIQGNDIKIKISEYNSFTKSLMK